MHHEIQCVGEETFSCIIRLCTVTTRDTPHGLRDSSREWYTEHAHNPGEVHFIRHFGKGGSGTCEQAGNTSRTGVVLGCGKYRAAGTGLSCGGMVWRGGGASGMVCDGRPTRTTRPDASSRPTPAASPTGSTRWGEAGRRRRGRATATAAGRPPTSRTSAAVVRVTPTTPTPS